MKTLTSIVIVVVAHGESELTRIDKRIVELKEQQADNKIFDATVQSWRNTDGWLKALKSDRDGLITLLRPDRFNHAKTLFNEMQPVQRIIVKVVSALRKEIHLLANESQFLEQLADMETRAMAALHRAYGISANGEL